MLINCKSLAERLTPQTIKDQLAKDGWDLQTRWNMEWAAAGRVYGKTFVPVHVSYEGMPWFVYDEAEKRCPNCGHACS